MLDEPLKLISGYFYNTHQPVYIRASNRRLLNIAGHPSVSFADSLGWWLH